MVTKYPTHHQYHKTRNVQLHVLVDERTYRLFLDSLEKLGYGTLAEAVRECIRNKIKQAERLRQKNTVHAPNLDRDLEAFSEET